MSNKTHVTDQEERAPVIVLLKNNDVNLHPPIGLVLPSWQQRQWRLCCPLGWHDLHWCLWADAGNAAGEAREEETGYHGYKSRKGSYHGDTHHVEERKKNKQSKQFYLSFDAIFETLSNIV